MNLLHLLNAPLVIIMACALPAGAALENRLDSLGPLKRYDPYEETMQSLVKIHGNPRLGLPGTAEWRLQRVSDSSWYLELGDRVALMEPDYKTGEVALKEVIELSPEWCISPDGALIFATRRTEKSPSTGECFDLATGTSKWTFERNQIVMDVCFTPDGSQVVILHKAARPSPDSAEISWYDAKSGELVRRVGIPGSAGATSGAISTDYLAFSGDWLCVARSGHDASGECFIIKPGAVEPEKIEVGALGNEEEPRVEVGGANGEFVVFYSDSNAVLYRREGSELKQIQEVELEGTSEGNSYSWCACFTPDGKNLVLSSCWKSIYIPTGESGGTEKKEFLHGSRLGDFSTDGKYFVAFHDGGGRIFDSSSWEVIESFDTKIHPPHCCPIDEAGYSLSGNYIVSCDGARLLLWSKEGQQLAELYSPRYDAKEAVRMQSPIILEQQDKIFAADGYDFLEWNLAELHKRLARKPDNIPRVKGEVVFRDRKQNNKSPEVMNISIDSKGENIVTATRSVVRYRPLAASAPIVVRVPKDDIFMNPRSFMPGATNSSIIVRAGRDAFTLDLAGKENAVPLAQSMIGANVAANRSFCIFPNNRGYAVWTYEFGKRNEAANLIALPADWNLSPENAILSSDGRWIIASPRTNNLIGVLAVIDIAKRQIVYSQPVKWMITSLSLSADGKRLLTGSSNRSIYEFDFLKMTSAP
jgi:WD40 repeat protein